MANEQNLIPIASREPREREEIARKGGEASQRVQKEKKMMKEMLKTILSLPEKDEALINHMKELGIEDEDLINQTSILVKQIEKAKLGDSTAVQFIRDTVGEKPVDKVQANVFNYEESLKAVGGDEY
nr:MAG TPA: DNA repair and recombination protein RING HEPTAMER HET [Caudoviricetes sp.]